MCADDTGDMTVDEAKGKICCMCDPAVRVVWTGTQAQAWWWPGRYMSVHGECASARCLSCWHREESGDG